jgi:hypothetical protein
MDAYSLETMARLPLAEAVLRLSRQVLDDGFLADLFERCRGTGSEQKVNFALLTLLMFDALNEHQGSGRQSFHAARAERGLPATDAAVYGKLRRVPLPLSEAFLREATARLRCYLPRAACQQAPAALGEFAVMIVDGKKLKRLPKRLGALRHTHGKVLGGKVVAGLLLNEGLVVAMHVSPDGEANDAPLTPGLLSQLTEGSQQQRRLYVADRQFCDLKIPASIQSAGQAFVIRFCKKTSFFPEAEPACSRHAQRLVQDVVGWVGSPRDPRRLRVRQITLARAEEEDVILVTNLFDATRYPAELLLELYLQRWTIERVFQQVTEVFHLDTFVASSPQGAIFQFALCALLYNLLQALRSYLAVAHQHAVRSLSTEMIFVDACKQLTASAQLISNNTLLEWLDQTADAMHLPTRLLALATRTWSSLWLKSPAKKPTRPKANRPVPGNHSSAWKLIQAAKPPPR